jgi:hypothetical protein
MMCYYDLDSLTICQSALAPVAAVTVGGTICDTFNKAQFDETVKCLHPLSAGTVKKFSAQLKVAGGDSRLFALYSKVKLC